MKDIESEKMVSMNLTRELIMPGDLFKPENFVPPGAGALVLGIDVAQEELGLK